MLLPEPRSDRNVRQVTVWVARLFGAVEGVRLLPGETGPFTGDVAFETA
jgi:hypothetical protein